ncbi:uncharacterized protein LOC112510090 [Cynara cardunculus var. scolymus]|uniref:Uncharacterized protein n=1 Tax=Cynara cardunculus var. scolymus TaxID=59895 RepID=A0A118K3N4_CYNCS|nr:uncharacterized protein LOC112510090 [Cynara cardunculus var. scolymus]KVI06223.1 hypothetical protein Ccrd_015436 [Cynara cardunculus var. scolymus]
MLGRVRACSLSSLEVLEMERTPKLLKDDSLSIYEKTLLKLQQGSKRNLSLIPEESMKTDDTSPSMATNEAALVAVNGSDYGSTDSSDNQSMIIAKEEPRGNLSVVYLFSRYKTSRNDNISSSDDSAMTMAMAMEDDYSSTNTSPGLQQECIIDSLSPN